MQGNDASHRPARKSIGGSFHSHDTFHSHASKPTLPWIPLVPITWCCKATRLELNLQRKYPIRTPPSPPRPLFAVIERTGLQPKPNSLNGVTWPRQLITSCFKSQKLLPSLIFALSFFGHDKPALSYLDPTGPLGPQIVFHTACLLVDHSIWHGATEGIQCILARHLRLMALSDSQLSGFEWPARHGFIPQRRQYISSTCCIPFLFKCHAGFSLSHFELPIRYAFLSLGSHCFLSNHIRCALTLSFVHLRPA